MLATTVPDLASLAGRVRSVRSEIDRELGKFHMVQQRHAEVEGQIASLDEEVLLYEQVTALLNSVGEERQDTAQRQIESLVTHGLQTVFDESLSFHLVRSVKANRVNIEFLVRSTVEGQEFETPVMEARGGGLAATVGFLLRIVVMMLSGERRLLFLDETFAHLSAEYEPRMAEFLRELVDRTGMQIILVTHSTAYADSADMSYRFSLVDGVTQVTN